MRVDFGIFEAFFKQIVEPQLIGRIAAHKSHTIVKSDAMLLAYADSIVVLCVVFRKHY